MLMAGCRSPKILQEHSTETTSSTLDAEGYTSVSTEVKSKDSISNYTQTIEDIIIEFADSTNNTVAIDLSGNITITGNIKSVSQNKKAISSTQEVKDTEAKKDSVSADEISTTDDSAIETETKEKVGHSKMQIILSTIGATAIIVLILFIVYKLRKLFL